jgi:hypothetical protein
MIFYCKPYCKISYDKKNYNETISKPSYLLKEKERVREIFLNGEVTEKKKLPTINKVVKRTMICLKALQIDDQLAREAIRNVLNKNQIAKP